MKNTKVILFVALGAAFWFNAAMIIRFWAAAVFTENNPKLILFYLLGIPLTLASLFATKLISKLQYSELLKPVVIMTFTATFLDGVALTWFRKLYSESFEVALHGAAWILWGVGLGLLFSFYLDLKGSKNISDKGQMSNNLLQTK
jgi:hypothetical protein